MIEKAASGVLRPGASRTTRVVGLAALLAVAIVVGHAGAPYLFKRATLLSEISTQVRATTGLTISTKRARFDLLPRPHVTMSNVHVADPSGKLTVDAAALNGDVRLLPLIVGRLELSSATLMHPHLSIDLDDGEPIKPDSMIGRALNAVDPPKNAAEQRLGSVTLVDGAAVVKGRSLRRALSLSDLNMTVDWRDLDSPATLTGSLRYETTSAEIAAWIARPSSFMRGEPSAIALRVHSAPLDLSANGHLASTNVSTFKGHVVATAPSMEALTALGSPRVTLPAAFANLKIDGDARVDFTRDGLMAVDLQRLRLRADSNDYEGTIGYQSMPRPLVSGTLASDQLRLAPFVAHAPQLFDAAHHWAQTSLMPGHVEPVDLDVRISAAHLRLAPYLLDDAALSIMTRGDRTEISLNEAKAYGGAAKGRLSFGFGAEGLNVRGAGTLTGADAAALGWDALGRQLATGTLSGSASLESTGATPAALMAHLQGWARARASNGDISGLDLGRALRDAGPDPTDLDLQAIQKGHTPFSALNVGVHVSEGIAAVDEGSMDSPNAVLTLEGTADVGARALDLHADVRRPATGGAAGAPLRFVIKGDFDKVVVAPARDSPGATP